MKQRQGRVPRNQHEQMEQEQELSLPPVVSHDNDKDCPSISGGRVDVDSGPCLVEMDGRRGGTVNDTKISKNSNERHHGSSKRVDVNWFNTDGATYTPPSSPVAKNNTRREGAGL